MRVFIAINFSNEIKNALQDCIGQLKSQGINGNYTHEENLHMTLAFIGDTKQIDTLKQIIHDLNFTPFEISLKGFGCFNDLLWVGINRCKELMVLADELKIQLINAGFKINSHKFRPHITIARQVSNTNPDIVVPNASMTVTKISLMESKRVYGKLVYKELN